MTIYSLPPCPVIWAQNIDFFHLNQAKIVKMQHVGLLMLLGVFYAGYPSQGEILSNDASDINLFYDSSDPEPNSDLLDDGYWDSDLTSPLDATNEVLPDDSIVLDPCSSSSGLLERRGETCTNPEQNQKPPDVEVRPLGGRTKDAPLLPMYYNWRLCPPDLMSWNRLLVMCDSGVPTDRHPTQDPSVFYLSNCSPCTG